MTSECYSCMSKAYLNSWTQLTLLYYFPANFTDYCEHPDYSRAPIGTKLCTGPCVTVAERTIVGGVTVGYNYIRGCSTRIVTWGLDQAMLKRISTNAAVNKCQAMPAKLFLSLESKHTSSRHMSKSVKMFDHFIIVCSCRGNRCNGNLVPIPLINMANRRLCSLMTIWCFPYVSCVLAWIAHWFACQRIHL